MATLVARFWPMAGFCGDRRGGGSGYVGIDVVEGVDLWGSAWRSSGGATHKGGGALAPPKF